MNKVTSIEQIQNLETITITKSRNKRMTGKTITFIGDVNSSNTSRRGIVGRTEYIFFFSIGYSSSTMIYKKVAQVSTAATRNWRYIDAFTVN